MGTSHTIETGGPTLHGYFSRDYAPVLTVDPGDSVRFSTLDAFWLSGPPTSENLDDWPRSEHHRAGYGHALVGPIAVRGAEPGMVLEVRVDEMVPGEWGTTVAGGWPSVFNERYREVEGKTLHTWDLDPVAMTGRNQHGHTVALRPFLGVMGMPPAEPGEHSTTPPRSHGGNLDCKELVAGSTLYLPVPVAGGLFSAGDGHAAQGDGEISGTAIECPMERVELTFGLRDDWELAAPAARTPAGDWLTLGLGDTLDDAAYAALEGMFALLQRLLEVSRRDAIALASVVVDLRVTQIVNQVVGAHAVLPAGAITEG